MAPMGTEKLFPPRICAVHPIVEAQTVATMNESRGLLATKRRIDPLFGALLPVLRGSGRNFEIIAVNDGSRDLSLQRLRAADTKIPELRVIDFRRNLKFLDQHFVKPI